MKKNVMMRIASILLVCVLITTCGISGTFAKYVTAGQAATDSARVAKWGVVITAVTENANNLFTVGDGVKVTDDAVVVAPGTSGTLSNINVTGTPEVSVKVSYTATVDLGDNWKDDADKFYCPLIVTVGTTAYCGLSYASVEDFEAAIATAIAGVSNTYDAETILANVVNDDLVVSWEWLFNGNETEHTALSHTHTTDNEQTNERDTDLGDKAAGGNAPTISITVTCTIEQTN